MTMYEELLNNAESENVVVIERYDLSDTRLKGLYCDNTIALGSDIDTTAARSCILAEELGHYHTSAGNILDQSSVANRKQERRARIWSYNRLIGLDSIVSAYKAGCKNAYEMAEHLNVTEAFLQEALDCYRSKYGLCTTVDNYTIFFEPGIAVLELI